MVVLRDFNMMVYC